MLKLSLPVLARFGGGAMAAAAAAEPPGPLAMLGSGLMSGTVPTAAAAYGGFLAASPLG
jgi:hypothetical protein